MEKIRLRVESGICEIYFGGGWESLLSRLCYPGNTFIITDSNVNSLYKDKFPDFPVLVVEAGEKSKSFQMTSELIVRLAGLGADRNSLLVGIGGGMVSDLTGLVASLFMRGIDCAFVSTTLLAQVDAGIGGKNGVNAGGIKNIAGTFRQPEFVICDPLFLSTLPLNEYRSGLGEVVKYGLIGNRDIFLRLEERYVSGSSPENDFCESVIPECIKIKTAIVEMDEKEGGKRRLLNLGHTAGHAIEAATGLPHGVAVAHGIAFAALVSEEMGYLSYDERERIEKLLEQMDLLPPLDVAEGKISGLVFLDKKRAMKDISFVFLKGIGEAVIEKVPLEVINGWLKKKGY
ncbi:MAG: 3-dehydroquinate synthase [Bacteroidales bacterium]|nr:3-dehydroquinate synthase [Bacteroidales bacterium]